MVSNGLRFSRPSSKVGRHQATLDIVPAETERQLGEIVGAETEELRLLGDLVSPDGSPRRLDHGADGDIELLLTVAMVCAMASSAQPRAKAISSLVTVTES